MHQGYIDFFNSYKFPVYRKSKAFNGELAGKLYKIINGELAYELFILDDLRVEVNTTDIHELVYDVLVNNAAYTDSCETEWNEAFDSLKARLSS